MPVSKHYGGHGEEVMANMKREYGPEEGKRVFYATENARKNKRGSKKSSKRRHRKGRK